MNLLKTGGVKSSIELDHLQPARCISPLKHTLNKEENCTVFQQK